MQFLIENWKFLVEITILVGSFLVLILKRVFKVNIPESILAVAFSMIPTFIEAAEEQYGAGNGAIKKEYVISEIIAWISKTTNIDSSFICKSFEADISDFIEVVLSCPIRKKGDNDVL